MSRLARRISGSGFAAFLILAAAAAAQDPSTWAKFSPPASRFKIALPGIPTEGYESDTGTHTFEIRSGDERTMVSWRDLSKELFRATPEQVLEGERDRFLRILPGAKLLRSAPARVGEFPGLTWVLDTSPANRSPLRMKGIAVLAKRRLFIAAYMGNRYRFDEGASDRVLATFEILE
jgi:hypothetical protein